VIAIYARILLWPHPLTVEYFWVGGVAPPLLWVGGLAVVTTTVAALIVRRSRALGIWCGLIVAGLSPVIHLLPFFELVAERYLYLPMVGFAVLVASGWERIDRYSHSAAKALLAGLLATWTALSLNQCLVWRDQISLFEHAVSHAPMSPVARTNLATAYVHAGLADSAVEHWQALVNIDPLNLPARYNLARFRFLEGRPDEARAILGARETWLDDASALALWDELAGMSDAPDSTP
jgi:tetratricopeptide (TPR) repeat protein